MSEWNEAFLPLWPSAGSHGVQVGSNQRWYENFQIRVEKLRVFLERFQLCVISRVLFSEALGIPKQRSQTYQFLALDDGCPLGHASVSAESAGGASRGPTGAKKPPAEI